MSKEDDEPVEIVIPEPRPLPSPEEKARRRKRMIKFRLWFYGIFFGLIYGAIWYQPYEIWGIPFAQHS